MVLHLASFVQLVQLSEITLVCADVKLCELVAELGYDVINRSGDNKKSSVKFFNPMVFFSLPKLTILFFSFLKNLQ